MEDLDRWIAEYRKVAGENTFITIIGNKIDLVGYRTVTTNEGRKFSLTRGFPFYESSAKLGGAVIPKIYIELVRKCLARIRT